MNAILWNTNEDIRLQIAQRCRHSRKQQLLTQQQLASRSGVSYGSLKRFEQKGEISLENLVAIAIALGFEDDFQHLFERKAYTSIEEVIRENHR